MLPRLALTATLASSALAIPLNWNSFFSSSWSGSADSSSSGTSAIDSSQSAATSTSTSSFTGNVSLPFHFVYDNRVTGTPPDPAEISGFKAFAMTFWGNAGPSQNAATWHGMSQADQQAVHAKYQAAGVLLLVSAFGSLETPVTSGEDPAGVANALATWVKGNNVDGCDIDFEDFAAMRNGDTGVQWLITFQTTLRSALGDGYFISHAPIAPWFTTDTSFFGGGYLAVDKAVGSSINLYALQLYNQDQYYTTCQAIVRGGGSDEAFWPRTALDEIIASGISADKLLMGKPVTSADASSGYTDLATLAECVKQAKATGWNAGMMAWAYPDSTTQNFLSTVWS